jgi:hypothetical protein
VITAIVLVHVESDRIPEVAEAIADLEGVSEVYSVTGGADLIAMVRARERKSAWRESWRASTTYSTPRLLPGQPDATRKAALPAIPKRPSSSTTDQ